MDNQNFGKEVFTKSFDPEFINGWGKRTYNWEMGVSVQQELMPRVGVTVGYFRRSFGNFYTADNRLTTTADYTPFSIPIPVDPRLPGGGGGTVRGLYNLVPGKVGQEDLLLAAVLELRRDDRELARRGRERQRAAAQRPDRARRHEHGPALQDNCAVRSALPETYSWASTAGVQTTRVLTSTGGLANPYCRVVEPFFTTSFRGLATYVVPKIDLQVSGTWRSDPGPELAANYVVTNAIALPVARPQPVVGQRHGQPDRARHVVRRAHQQHRHASRENLPLPRDARAGWRGRLQRAEHRRRDGSTTTATARPARG